MVHRRQAGQNGTGSPVGSVTPEFVSQVYVDTDTDIPYFSTGLTSADWVEGSLSVHMDSVFLKIGEAEDGVIQAPATVATVVSGNGKVEARKFDSSTDEDVIFSWVVPDDLDASYGIKFSVCGVITEAVAPASGEGVAFQLKGYSVGTGDSLGGTPGAAVVSKDADLNASGCDAQYDVFKTVLSEDVTVTGLLAGELAMLHLSRDTDDADDDYAQDVGVFGLLIQFTRERVIV